VKENPILTRETFRTSRLLEYFSEKELTLQTGHEPGRWPEVVLKELIDNALDACEEAGTLPEISIESTPDQITVKDNGPGIPPKVIESILDFSVRVSSNDAYVSPTRGAQGNALKTVVAIPYVLGGGHAQTVIIASHGQRHSITIALDRIEQTPAITHGLAADPSVKTGTCVTVPVPRLETNLHAVFLPLVESYSLFNPHASFILRFSALDVHQFDRTALDCRKWRPSDPTSAHWYTGAQLRGLMAAYVTAERRGGPALTVRDFIGQFRGLSSTRKRKAILTRLPRLAGLSLSACVENGDIDEELVASLLAAMRGESKPVKPLELGHLGKAHLQTWLEAHAGIAATVTYKRVADLDNATELPFVFEFAFGARQDTDPRRLFVGINAAPTLVDPFRMLKGYGVGLDGLLNAQYLGPDAPVTCVAHLSCPHLHYTDRGKSSLEAL
jgi:hypothetical protein